MQQSLSDSRSASLPITGPVRVIGPGTAGRKGRGGRGGRGGEVGEWRWEGGERGIKGKGEEGVKREGEGGGRDGGQRGGWRGERAREAVT